MIVMNRNLCGVRRRCEGDLGSFSPDGRLEGGLCEWLCAWIGGHVIDGCSCALLVLPERKCVIVGRCG